jgi:hydrogenase expression/formation protein HypE
MTEENTTIQGAVCPVPLQHGEHIVLGHGSGGKMSHDLIRRAFLPAFDNPALARGDDAAQITLMDGARLAISTDAHVVSPLFFPGGDIGRLAVCGTVNDVAVLGARPLYLTASFILEEGLPMEQLQRIISSMQQAAGEAGVQIVAGDTKVVQKGKADGVYISTAGVGVINPGVEISGSGACPGDVVLLSGPVGDHGIAVLAARGELGFETGVVSDVAPLNSLVQAIMNASSGVHVLRDPTRGGVATTLNEIARQSEVCIQMHEQDIPIRPAVAAVCEMLGFDPLYIANEGKLLAIVSPESASAVLAAMQAHPYGAQAAIIGEVLAAPQKRVLMKTSMGATRIVDMLAGELLPRIC